MSEGRYQSFESFFPCYLHEHRNPLRRALYFVGTAGFFSVFA